MSVIAFISLHSDLAPNGFCCTQSEIYIYREREKRRKAIYSHFHQNQCWSWNLSENANHLETYYWDHWLILSVAALFPGLMFFIPNDWMNWSLYHIISIIPYILFTRSTTQCTKTAIHYPPDNWLLTIICSFYWI